MKFDDPSLLSAHLDDELDPTDRRHVELALKANPRLEQELSELKSVRDTFSSLPVPEPPRSSFVGVMLGIAELDPQHSRLHRQTRLAMLWVSVGVIAACFLLAWSLQLLSIRQAFIRSGPMPPPAIAVNRDEERGETAPIHVDSDLPLD